MANIDPNVTACNGKLGQNEVKASRADEVEDLLQAVQSLIVPFIRSADEASASKGNAVDRVKSNGTAKTTLLESHSPQELIRLLEFTLPEGNGRGKDGILDFVSKLLQYSVNTWDQGFLDKLYSSTNAVGVVSELLLAILNTNVHVYQVAPALTIIEKETSRKLANLFGFNDAHAGGISTQGGSASNTTSVIVARNNLYPETKISGNAGHDFVLFASAHGHYSLEKAAQMCGLGSSNVWAVPVDRQGKMIPSKLDELVRKANSDGKTPFYVSATAGTTVLGSYDPFLEIHEICKKHNLWMHIDACWGGPAVFSSAQKFKLNGSHLADSLAVNPHKMMGTPVTCSFLLGPDLRRFHLANTLPAGYLFHNDRDDDMEVWDLADLTLQCGRRGDSLKLALSWIYYGMSGFEAQIDHAFSIASYFASQVSQKPNFVLVSQNPPPCLQVCFYYASGGNLYKQNEKNTRATKAIVERLLGYGFMIDYAPGENGSFFRVVVNRDTRRETVDRLLEAMEVASKGLSSK